MLNIQVQSFGKYAIIVNINIRKGFDKNEKIKNNRQI